MEVTPHFSWAILLVKMAYSPKQIRRECKYVKYPQSLFVLLSFVSTTFKGFFEARAEVQKYFRSFFGSNENLKNLLSRFTDL